MSTNYGQQVYARGAGTASTTLLDAHYDNRDPNTADTAYPLGKHWVNTGTNAVWYLATFSTLPGNLIANWAKLTNGLSGAIDTIDGIGPDGTGNFTIESTNGSIAISAIVNGLNLEVATSPTKYDGNSGGDVVPNASNQLFIVGNNTTGINVVGNSPINTLTIVGLTSTTTQQGTVTLATNAQAIAGTDAANAVTSATLAAKLGTQTAHSLAVFEGTSSALTALGVATNGQIPIGSTGADPVLATITAGSGISIVNGAGSIQISATGTSTLNVTSVNHAASPYTVLNTDDFLAVDTSAGVVSILLPDAPSTGRVWIIKDSKGTSGTSAITVTTVGGVVTIDGSTSYTLNTAYKSINVIFDGTSYEVY